MDRKYKVMDKVHVHQDSREGPLLDSFEQQPYSCMGLDNYRYKNVMYKGYYNIDRDYVYILLSEPLSKGLK